MKQLLFIFISVSFFSQFSFGQTETETYRLPDVCISEKISTSFNDIEISSTCYDSLGKVTKEYESILKCDGYLTFSTIEFIDSTDFEERVIGKTLIYELEKLNEGYWIKRNYGFNGKKASEHKVKQIKPLEISRTDSIDYLDLTTGKAYIGEIIKYVGFIIVE